MAYSPIEQGRVLENQAVRRVGLRQHRTPAQVALAWVVEQRGVVAIPKSSNPDHVRQNREALDVQLTGDDLKELNHEFPPPARKASLEMI